MIGDETMDGTRHLNLGEDYSTWFWQKIRSMFLRVDQSLLLYQAQGEQVDRLCCWTFQFRRKHCYFMFRHHLKWSRRGRTKREEREGGGVVLDFSPLLVYQVHPFLSVRRMSVRPHNLMKLPPISGDTCKCEIGFAPSRKKCKCEMSLFHGKWWTCQHDGSEQNQQPFWLFDNRKKISE